MRVYIALFAMAVAPLNEPMITLEQGKSMACIPACHHIGQDSGFYKDGYCGCVKWVPYDEMMEAQTFSLPKRAKSNEKQENHYYPDIYKSW